MWDCGLSYSIPVPILKFVHFSLRKIWCISVLALISLVTLTFNLLTSKWGPQITCAVGFLSANFQLPAPFLGSGMGQTDWPTDNGHQHLMAHTMGHNRTWQKVRLGCSMCPMCCASGGTTRPQPVLPALIILWSVLLNVDRCCLLLHLSQSCNFSRFTVLAPHTIRACLLH